MKRILENTLVVGLVAVLAVAGAYSAAADEIASMEPRGGLLAFRSISSEGMTLTVAGRGYRKTESFRSGQMPSFTPVDAEGYMLPDAIYTWELAENPRLEGAPAVAWDKPANGRLTHRAPAEPGRTQSGSFSIRSGRIVDATLVEAATAPEAKFAGTARPVQQIDDSDAATAAREQ